MLPLADWLKNSNFFQILFSTGNAGLFVKSLKYEMFTPSGCKYISIRKFECVN